MRLGKAKAHLISFGLGGHGIDLVFADDCNTDREGVVRPSTSHLSGYENPESFERHAAAGDYDRYDLEECPVVDKRDVLRENPGLAWSSPMHGALLRPTAVDKIGDASQEFARILGAMNAGNVWGSLCTLYLSGETFSGFDQVGTALYLAIWQGYGARIGTVRSGRIEWQDPATVRSAGEQLSLGGGLT